MFATYVGATQDESSKTYLRPETAQAIFVQFKNVLEVSRKKLRSASRRSARHSGTRSTRATLPSARASSSRWSSNTFARRARGGSCSSIGCKERLRFYENIGLPREKLHVQEIPAEERAFYSQGTYDIEFEFPFGIQELEGVAYRTDYDLTQHIKGSGKPLDYFDEETKAAVCAARRRSPRRESTGRRWR